MKESEEKPIKPHTVESPSKVSSSAKKEVGKENSAEDYENLSEMSKSNLRTRLNRLGKLYSASENVEALSSPVHKRTETISRYKNDFDLTVQPKLKSTARTARFAALARDIGEWEDDLTNLTPASNNFPAAQKVQSPSRAPVTSFRGQIAASNSPIKSLVPPNNQVNSPSRAAVFSSPTKSTVNSPVRASPQPTSSLASSRGVQMGSRALQGNSSPVRVTSVVKKATKTLVWDKAVIATLVS